MNGSSTLLVIIFFAATAASLGASAALVRSIESICGAFGIREAALGLLAALAADGPEITSAVTALVHHDPSVSAGVVFGSNAFNLATLLGLAAVIAGTIRLDRSVIALEGVIGFAVAGLGLLVVAHLVPPVVAGVIVGCIVVPYVVVSTLRSPPKGNHRIGEWIRSSISAEEAELHEAIEPKMPFRFLGLVALGALVGVIGFSIVMEQSATTLGARWGVATAVVGGVVLAAVTSIPNAVAAVYFAGRGRASATLATAMNSNTANICFGLLVPIAFVELAPRHGSDVLIAGATLALTAIALALAWRGRGLHRWAGATILGAYLVIVAIILVAAHQ